MPKGTPKPVTGIETALAPAFERQKQMLGAARKVARAVAGLSPADARQALELVLEAQAVSTRTADDQNPGASAAADPS